MKKTWNRARLLAWWHGGKPAQYVPSLMKQGKDFSCWQVDLVPTCAILLLVNLIAVAYIISM
ncbi:hypothetical protein vBAspATola_10 [Aeromonas phage vB_AspA_Tola]|nr:hypothetical protein vBAspATola_10 [Aeromonas phage vB_AspA_Tola]